MTRVGLTERQRALYDFIASEIEAGRPVPSYRQMAAHLGLGSTSGVHRKVEALVERGWLVRHPYHARAIALVDRSSTPGAGDAARLAIPRKVAERVRAHCVRHSLTPRDFIGAALTLALDLAAGEPRRHP